LNNIGDQLVVEKYKWIILILVSFSSLLAYTHVFIYSPLIPSFIAELNLTSLEASLPIVSFGIAYTISGVFWGHLIGRYKIKWILLIGLFCISIPQFFISFLPPYILILFLRFILGLGVSNIRVTGISYLHSWFPSSTISKAIGIFNSAVLIGMSIALGVTPIIEITYGWLFPFMLFSIVTFCFIAFFIIIIYKEPKLKSTRVIEDSMSARKITEKRNESLYRNPSLWVLCFITFSIFFYVYATLTWIPPYAKDIINLTDIERSIVVPFLAIIGIPASLVGGYISDKTGKRILVTAAGLLINVSILILVGFTITSWITFLFTLIIIGWGTHMSFGPAFSLHKEIFSPKNMDKALGIISTCAFSSAIIAPFIGGFLLDLTGSYIYLFLLTALISIAGVIASIILKKISKLN
jgi:predicted MFS family arabinose efflux permease